MGLKRDGEGEREREIGGRGKRERVRGERGREREEYYNKANR